MLSTSRLDDSAGFALHVTPVERVLRRSALLGVGEFRCAVDHPQFHGGGPQACAYVVFPRSSVRLIHAHWRPQVSTPNVVSLYNAGDSYERRAVSAEGDHCDWIALAPELLRDIAEPYIGEREIESGRIFARPLVPIAPAVYAAQHAMFAALNAAASLPLLAVESRAISLVQSVLASTRTASRQAPRVTPALARRQIDIVEHAKAVLARRFGEGVSLSEAAREVHCSPGYLCRSFKRLTGTTLHAFQQQLRLRASLHELSTSRGDLASVAMQFGFATHSHFSDVFRRQFGVTPTQFLRRCPDMSP
jgi:AraC-like DNA-binding protein